MIREVEVARDVKVDENTKIGLTSDDVSTNYMNNVTYCSEFQSCQRSGYLDNNQIISGYLVLSEIGLSRYISSYMM